MYNGYFCFGGTEIINNPRAAGYGRTASQIVDATVPVPTPDPEQLLATNWYQNPSFKKGAGTVRVMTNRAQDPRGTAFRSTGIGFYDNRFPGSSDTTYSLQILAAPPFPGGPLTGAQFRIEVAGLSDRGFHLAGNPQVSVPDIAQSLPVAPGDSFDISLWALGNWTPTMRFVYRFHNGSAWTSVATPSPSTTGVLEPSGWRSFRHTITVPAGATYMNVMFVNLSASTAPPQYLTCTALMIGPVGQPYMDGVYSPDPDLAPSWIGAANNSASQLRGTEVEGVSSTPETIAIRSSDWAADGTFSLRIQARIEPPEPTPLLPSSTTFPSPATYPGG